MIQSTELKDIILQWYGSITSGEILGSVEHLFSRQEGFLVIGTDPTEWWQGSEEVIKGYTAKAGTYMIKVDDIKAYCEGTVGWVADRVEYTLPNSN